jgi:hypothetical protein
MAKNAAGVEVTLPEVLQMSTRSYAELLCDKFDQALAAWEEKLATEHREVLEAKALREMRRTLKQLTTALPEAGE